MQTHLLPALLGALLFILPTAAAPKSGPVVEDTVAVFRFRPGKLLFEKGYKVNERNMTAFFDRIRQEKAALDDGRAFLRVWGFCNSFPSPEESLAAAKERSNQVKSFFILYGGLTEENFRTANRARFLQGPRDVVYVTLNTTEQLPAVDSVSVAVTEEPVDTPSSTTGPEIETAPPAPASPSPAIARTPEVRRFRMAIKTNLPVLAATVANLGVEFGFGRHFSLDIPVLYSPYVVKRDYRLQLWAVQPEFRYWFREPLRGHFLGLHAHTGQFNVAVDRETRYQDRGGNSPLWGFGLSYGYSLKLSRCWAMEFNLGAGYANIRYDSFYNLRNGARIDSGTKHYWGLTRAGISIAYRIR